MTVKANVCVVTGLLAGMAALSSFRGNAATADEPSGSARVQARVAAPPAAPTSPKAATPKESGPRLLSSLPKPGKVVEMTTDKKLGITHAWLDNGVRVHHRYLNFPEGKVNLSITLAGGQIEETAANEGITQAAGVVGNYAATHQLSHDELRKRLAGVEMVFGVTAMEDGFTFQAEAMTGDVEAAFEEMYVLLTDGIIEKDALAQWQRNNLRLLGGYERRVQFVAVRALEDLVSGSDPRRRLLSAERIMASSVAEAQAWYDRLRRTAPMEVAVVGDVKLDKVMPIILRYVGSLPKRSRTADYLDKLRHINRPKGPLTVRTVYDSPANQAIVIAGFMGCDGQNVSDRRALQMAALIVDRRLADDLRDRQKLTTSIRVRSDMDWAFRDAGRFSALARCTSEKAEELAKAIHAAFATFGKKDPAPKEMYYARKMLDDFDQNVVAKQTYYWWLILKQYDLHGRDARAEVGAKAAYDTMSRSEVRRVFNKYYTPDRQFTVIAVPKDYAAPETKKPAD